MTRELQILIDTREQRPWDFSMFSDCQCRICTLRTGDYSLKGAADCIAIERKSLDDLVASVTRGRSRFQRECERLSKMAFKVVVVESTLRQLVQGFFTSKARPQSILGSVTALQLDHGLPFIFAGGRDEARGYAYRWLLNAVKRIS